MSCLSRLALDRSRSAIGLLCALLCAAACGEAPAAPAASEAPPSIVAGSSPMAGMSQVDQYVRKSATEMTQEEIDRFKKAFQMVIDKKIMDQFATEHYDFMTHWHHGALLKTETISSVNPPEPAISRFLAWHRAFMMELENMMQQALEEAGDPSADQVFIPYWDWSHMDDMPEWTHLDQWKPTGVTAVAVEGFPKGHPAYGIQGQEYAVDLRRWPGQIALAANLPSAEHVAQILEEEEYYDFTTYLDFAPMLVVHSPVEAVQNLRSLLEAQGAPSFLLPLLRSLNGGGVAREDRFPALMAVIRLNNAASDPDLGGGLSAETIQELLSAVIEVFPLAPHGNAHLWAGGQNPDNTAERGTVTYFSELVIDPIFWMLHTELDRIFYTWETEHDGGPDLEDRDKMFQPWQYGEYYTLDALTDHDGLQYTYDQLYQE